MIEMLRHGIATGLIVCAGLIAGGSGGATRAQERPTREMPAGIRTVSYESPSVGRTLKYNVALPKSYEAEPDRRYPVLYLLHGFTSDYTAWAFLGAGKAAEPFDLIVVMVDSGNSWYSNWAESEGDAKNAWEDALIKDLMGHVDATYRTIARREGRAINGLSMGGYGAMTVGLRHPELFASVGSHSGAIGFARSIGDRLRKGEELSPPGREPRDVPNPSIGVPDFDSQLERTPKGKLFATAEQADDHDPFTLVTRVPADRMPHLYFDCGTEDFLYDSNREFAKLLLDKKISFTFGQSPGGHTPPYWSREIFNSVSAQYLALGRALEKNSERESDEVKDGDR
jgi:S-formylglutathione hydrolase FrmB